MSASRRPWVTNRPNRFSVKKLVALSGSTSARSVRAERGGEIAAVLDRVDPGEDRLQRRGAARVDPGLVEPGGIIIGDAALVGAGAGLARRGAGDDLAVAAVDHVGEVDERADPVRSAGISAWARQPPLA